MFDLTKCCDNCIFCESPPFETCSFWKYCLNGHKDEFFEPTFSYKMKAKINNLIEKKIK